MYVATDIPAGNGLIRAIDGDVIELRPDLRGNAQWWFWWHVALRGAAGRSVTLAFGERPCIGPAGIAISADGGASWAWSGPQDDAHRIELVVPAGCDDLRVAMSIPYTQAELDAATADLPGLRRGELCTSHGGRPVPLLELGPSPAEADAQLVLTARHHCCESMASFVLDGALCAAATAPELAPLRERVALVACPIMDADGVASGDQGKFRAPHDHNRDYLEGRYAETTALRALVDQGARTALPTASVDLHCPWIRGHYNEHIYIVGSGEPERAAQQRALAAALAAETSPDALLGFGADDILPHGEAWNTNPITPRRNCGRWFAGRVGCRLSATFEIPYGLARGHAVTPASARRFGAALARALQAQVLSEQITHK